MTPLQDHAFWTRQKLIRSKKNPEQLHYQALIAKGLSEVDAANMSGWHPIIPVDRFLRRFAWTLIVVCTTGMIVLYASSTAANMESKDKMQELTVLERAVTRCMKGAPMKIGQEWFKCTCLSSDDPAGCPEEAK
jgi:hypothetical protein